MKKLLSLCVVLSSLFTVAEAWCQDTLELEVAPFTVSCEENSSEQCIELLNLDGTVYGIYPQNTIRGFKPKSGFEYTLKVTQNKDSEGNTAFNLLDIVSELYVPQYDTSAPQLTGSFQVTGFDGRTLDINEVSIFINANNRIMNGTTGCNNYHFFFRQVGYGLVFSKVIAKKSRCPGQPFLDQQYFAMLNNVHHFKIDGNILKLYDISNKQLIEAQRLN